MALPVLFCVPFTGSSFFCCTLLAPQFLIFTVKMIDGCQPCTCIYRGYSLLHSEPFCFCFLLPLDRLIRVCAQEQLFNSITRCCTSTEVLLSSINLMFEALEVSMHDITHHFRCVAHISSLSNAIILPSFRYNPSFLPLSLPPSFSSLPHPPLTHSLSLFLSLSLSLSLPFPSLLSPSPSLLLFSCRPRLANILLPPMSFSSCCQSEFAWWTHPL